MPPAAVSKVREIEDVPGAADAGRISGTDTYTMLRGALVAITPFGTVGQ